MKMPPALVPSRMSDEALWRRAESLATQMMMYPFTGGGQHRVLRQQGEQLLAIQRELRMRGTQYQLFPLPSATPPAA